MARVTMEDALKKEKNRMKLVILAAKRSRQLLKGDEPRVKNTKNNREIVLALREIAAGEVSLKSSEKKKKPFVRRKRRRRVRKYFRKN
ncbi:MAG: DNA-directed RNA polymerase subunit omega [bacterium]